jgi:acetylornithine deacetylase/succinyl-diaminopimelate desuccinylase-like protein
MSVAPVEYLETHRPAFLEGLKSFLRIPSISTLPEHRPDLRRAAEFVAAELKQAGLRNCRLIEGPGNPLVCGEWLEAPGKPAILFYGHYDVQPPDPLDEWKSPPFEPAIRGDDIFARGASDDKGQTYLLIKAVEALLASRGALPVNVRFLIEGEEEVGGEHIESYLRHEGPDLGADAVVICDTEMFAPGLPTLCIGLRGIVYTEVEVTGAGHDLHSGVYGGVAPNPLQAIAEILSGLKDRRGGIQIPGFYDRVRPPSPAELAAWSRLPFDEKQYREKEVGVSDLVGEPGLSVFERTWARPTLEVHGIRGGFTGEGGKTVIPARAVAKISMRLVADMDPEETFRQFREQVERLAPRGVRSRVTLLSSAAPTLVNPENPFIQTAARAMQDVFGPETVYIRSGGSIPIVGLFTAQLGLPCVLMGFGLPDDNLHAPNEKFHLPNFFGGIAAIIRYLEMLGR